VDVAVHDHGAFVAVRIDAPLRTRKRLLRELLHFHAKPLRFSNHRNRDGEKFFREACQKGWEGLIGAASLFLDPLE